MSNVFDHQHWSFKRTEEIAPYGTPPVEMRKLWAAYIAEHEQPPVDPLLLEARELVASHYEAGLCYVTAREVRAGERDTDNYLCGVVSGLRRGIELGKAGA